MAAKPTLTKFSEPKIQPAVPSVMRKVSARSILMRRSWRMLRWMRMKSRPIRTDVKVMVPDMSFCMLEPISALKAGAPVRLNVTGVSSSWLHWFILARISVSHFASAS